jgi:hypothetical protein
MVERMVLALLLACVAFTGCANKREAAEAKVGPAVQRLPGVYDREGQDRLVLVIVPIYAPSLSDHTFYLQEMVADDPRRITSQRVVSFHPGNGKKLVQSTWALAEPARWRDGHMKPDLFKSMVKDDVRIGGRAEVSVEQLTGTELVFDAEGLFAAEGAARYRKR